MRLCMLLILLILTAPCPCLYAAPANPEPSSVSQPDGTAITIVTEGDEFQNWVEVKETGHTIIRNNDNGYWEYAEQAPDGRLRGSGIRVLPNGINAPHLPKGLKPPRNKEHEERMQQMVQETYQERLAAAAPPQQSAAAPGDWTPTPVSGAKKLLVILVSFADRPITTTPASWSTAVFDTAASSVAKYYKENSFDTLTVTPVAHSQIGNPAGIISVTIASNHPNLGGSYTFSSDQAWGNSALAQAASYINFNSFDTNGDNKLDTSEIVIYFVAAGYEYSAGSGLTPSMWAHAWWTTGTGLTAGSKNVQRWALNGEYYSNNTQMTMGVIAHELGHQMCGLPDLYDISSPKQNNAMGIFSLMASGSWGASYNGTGGTIPTTLDAWSREYLGWATPVQPTIGTVDFNYALSSPSAVAKFINAAKSTTEYFLVENRQPTSWDNGIKRWLGNSWSGGLLITHIDTTAGTRGSNDINSYLVNATTPGHQGVVPVQASTASCNMLVGTSCAGHATTLFYSTNKTSWTPATIPSSNYYDGTATSFSLISISSPSATMTALFSVAPTVTISSYPPAYSNAQQGTFSFTSSDGSATYECKINTDSYAGCSSPYSTAALPDGSHTFSVRASNAVGSSETSYTWTVDTIPPATTLSSGPENPTFATSATFTFSSPDATAIFQCQLDGGTYTPCLSSTSYSGLAPGDHTMNVRAVDPAGNIDATPASQTWTVNPCYVKIGTSCYSSLETAYAAAANSDTIYLQAVTLPEAFAANRSISIFLRGGYDASFSSVVGMTSILGLTSGEGAVDLAAIAM